MRRAPDALSFTAAVMVCPHCGESKLMHRVCSNCGFYRGRLMFDSAVSADGVAADVSDVDVAETDAAPSADE